ncbi:MAG: glycosyltransferase family 9 protein [Thermodesulfobacteriota bacterium]
MVDKLLVVHKGALGDFLLLWPTLLALSRYFGNRKLFWYGKNDFLCWLRPLGFENCSQNVRFLTDSLYDCNKLSAGLLDYRIIWFGLLKRTIYVEDSRLTFLTTVDPDRKKHGREVCREKLSSMGIKWPHDWQEVWRKEFGSFQKTQKAPVLFFPGSGNSGKNWPLVKFFELGKWLENRGVKVVFVLGPLEREKNVSVDNFATCNPDSLRELARVVRGARAVVGNDCGPMHLAGSYKVPGVGLFGPTSCVQWGAWGMINIQSPIECSPCSDTAVINCREKKCMEKIDVAMVKKEMETIL